MVILIYLRTSHQRHWEIRFVAGCEVSNLAVWLYSGDTISAVAPC
jgi:hypothetical protein